MQDEAVLFRETQRFRQWWLWIVILVAALPPIVLVAYGLYRKPEAVGVGAAVAVVPVAVLALFVFARLDVEVTHGAIVARFFPFHLTPRRIALSEIIEAKQRRYEPLTEYGGWGIRCGDGWAYNVSGDEGVQLVLAGGKRLLIGSQKAKELEAAITSQMARLPQPVPAAAAPPQPRSVS